MDDQRLTEGISDILKLCKRGAPASFYFTDLRLSAAYHTSKLRLGDTRKGANVCDLSTYGHY